MSNLYGNQVQTQSGSAIDLHAEEILQLGYTILPQVIPETELQEWRARIDEVYAQQVEEIGLDALTAIQEQDLARAPLLYDRNFIDLAMQPLVLELVHKLLGEWAILSLQNAIINRPATAHHQSHWHRDLPHARFTSSHPIGINALFAIDAFSETNGATQILPCTHHTLDLPSDDYIAKHTLPVVVPAGSAVLFDAMIFHCAGSNRSTAERRAVNHLYTLSMVKQQYDFPASLGEASQFDFVTQKLLGYPSAVPRDDKAWRAARASRLKHTV